MTTNIKLVSRFSEDEVEVFFLSFEKIARRLHWPVRNGTLLLRSVFVRGAQEVYSSLSEEQSEYEIVKRTVLSAYEQVPEAYRQKF